MACKPDSGSDSTNAGSHLHGNYSRGFAVGTLVGVTLAGVFNPVDKALYLMILKKRPFLTRANWVKPFEGLSQTLIVRTLGGGMFYPTFDLWRGALQRAGLEGHAITILAGQFTGAATAVLMNPMNAVKYDMWGKHDQTMRGTVAQMYQTRGWRAFTRAIHATVARDSVFGSVYAGSRTALHRLSGESGTSPSLASNLMGGSLAVALSSPFNYGRNMQFGTPDGQAPPSVPLSLWRLWEEVRFKRLESGRQGAASYLQQRLGLGWGTLRVAVGMSVGQLLYDFGMSIT